jgi:succinate dehydrogenase / fumarate reductase cytochrome b subunit
MSPSSLRYAYYPGCVAQGACRELYDSTQQVTQALGIELIELTQASCCGSGTFKEESDLLEDSVNARNLALGEALGLPILTHCSTCQGVLGRVNQKLKKKLLDHPNYIAHLNHLSHQSGGTAFYQGTGEVIHLLWVLVKDYGLERLAQQVKHSLAGMKCAPFYGCYLLRAYDIQGYDDPQSPSALEKIIETLGGYAIDYPGRTQCCGWPIASYAPLQSFSLAGRHILAALEAGAECMVTPCPLCHLNLDARQPEIEQVIGQRLGLPILHLPQLVGLALGIPLQQLGIQKHISAGSHFLHNFTDSLKKIV